MYLRLHRGSQQRTDARAKNILFYALWMLYALNTATFIVDILQFYWIDAVSKDDHGYLNFLQLVLQRIEIQYHIGIIQVTLFALCDFIAQSILVRTMAMVIIIHLIFQKDISLLDRLGLQHSCCDHSVILSIRILRYINLSSFTV